MFTVSTLLAGALAAYIIGLSKTGIPGGGLLAIPLFATVFEGRLIAGALVPVLMFADLFAIGWYRQHLRRQRSRPGDQHLHGRPRAAQAPDDRNVGLAVLRGECHEDPALPGARRMVQRRPVLHLGLAVVRRRRDPAIVVGVCSGRALFQRFPQGAFIVVVLVLSAGGALKLLT